MLIVTNSIPPSITTMVHLLHQWCLTREPVTCSIPPKGAFSHLHS